MLSLHFPKYKNFISEMSVYRDEKNGKGRDYCVSKPGLSSASYSGWGFAGKCLDPAGKE